MEPELNHIEPDPVTGGYRKWRGKALGWVAVTNTPRLVAAPTVTRSQIGGTHYKDMVIQPFEYIHKNNLGYLEGTAVKYVSRWRSKGGIQDLEKAIHALQYLIELEKGKEKNPPGFEWASQPARDGLA